MEQSYDSPPTAPASDDARQSLESAAAEFSKNIQDATGKLVSAADQFSMMSTGLTNAVNEAKAASAKAEEAQKAAVEAQAAAEAIHAKMDRDYSNLKGLMSDLQERIGALAVLARPFNMEAEPEAPAIADDSATENSSESSSEDTSSTTVGVPSPAGWQGWQG